ncbi:unnamed protein product [Discosporangium mesarthrocarpum]
MSRSDLELHLALFVAVMRVERQGKERSERADTAVDEMRVEALVRGYVAQAAKARPMLRPARAFLRPLLFCMACELLTVRVLGKEVHDTVGTLVSDYESQAKLWMTPAQNANRILRPLASAFLTWLRGNRARLHRSSAMEGLLRSIDKDLRFSLKSQVYESPEHFLGVIKSLRNRLRDMPLPPYHPSIDSSEQQRFDVSQTLKDVQREAFVVNGTPVAPSECLPCIRALLGSTLAPGWKSLDPAPPSSSKCHRKEGDESVLPSSSSSSIQGDDGKGFYREEYRCQPCLGGVCNTGPWEGDGDVGPEDENAGALRMYVEQCSWRVLHSVSRTASSGDSLFVVQDLFGGDGVLIKTSLATPEPIEVLIQGLSVRVTTVDKHDIYHSSDVDAPESPPRALMTVRTILKEVIRFSPCSPREQGSKLTWAPEERKRRTADAGINATAEPPQDQSARFLTIDASLPGEVSEGMNEAVSSAEISKVQLSLKVTLALSPEHTTDRTLMWPEDPM